MMINVISQDQLNFINVNINLLHLFLQHVLTILLQSTFCYV